MWVWLRLPPSGLANRSSICRLSFPRSAASGHAPGWDPGAGRPGGSRAGTPSLAGCIPGQFWLILTLLLFSLILGTCTYIGMYLCSSSTAEAASAAATAGAAAASPTLSPTPERAATWLTTAAATRTKRARRRAGPAPTRQSPSTVASGHCHCWTTRPSGGCSWSCFSTAPLHGLLGPHCCIEELSQVRYNHVQIIANITKISTVMLQLIIQWTMNIRAEFWFWFSALISILLL